MSIYSIQGNGWRYDFTHHGARYTGTWFKTKTEAKQAEVDKREEVRNPKQGIRIPTDMAFLELVNRRLDHLKAYMSERHYLDHIYLARNWILQWQGLICNDITDDMVQSYLFKRRKVSACTANHDLRCLRALFNYGLGKNWITVNPTKGIPFFPVEKRIKYIPPLEDVLKVIVAADFDAQDYLYTLKETMGRMGEINRLTWQDVNFDDRSVTLYTRKKKGGHLTPRKVAMTDKLFDILSHRYRSRDKGKPWVFWHRFWSSKEKGWVEGPYKDRKGLMKSLCSKAGVKYFRYHALRHLGASILDNANVNLGSIQRILGHENRTTTEIYLHSLGESEREAMKIFDQISEKSHTNPHTDKVEKIGS